MTSSLVAILLKRVIGAMEMMRRGGPPPGPRDEKDEGDVP